MNKESTSLTVADSEDLSEEPPNLPLIIHPQKQCRDSSDHMSVNSNSNEDARVNIDTDAITVDQHGGDDEAISMSSSEGNSKEGNDHTTTSSTSNKDRDTADG